MKFSAALLLALVLALPAAVEARETRTRELARRELMRGLSELKKAHSMEEAAQAMLRHSVGEVKQLNDATGTGADDADAQVALATKFDMGGATKAIGGVVDLVKKIMGLFGGSGKPDLPDPLGQNKFTKELDKKEEELQKKADMNIDALKKLAEMALKLLKDAWKDDDEEDKEDSEAEKQAQKDQAARDAAAQARDQAEAERALREGGDAASKRAERELAEEMAEEKRRLRDAERAERLAEEEARRLARENGEEGHGGRGRGRGRGSGHDGDSHDGLTPAERAAQRRAREAAELAEMHRKEREAEEKLRRDQERWKEEERRKIAAAKAQALRDALLNGDANKGKGGDGCEVGPWEHVHRLVREEKLLASLRPGDKCHRDEFGPHETPSDNIASAAKGKKAHVPHHHMSPGGVKCMDPRLAEMIINVAGYGVAEVVSFHGEHHNCNDRAPGGPEGPTMAVVFGTLDGHPLDRQHEEEALKVIGACEASGASAVFNINRNCGCECNKYTHSVLCAL